MDLPKEVNLSQPVFRCITCYYESNILLTLHAKRKLLYMTMTLDSPVVPYTYTQYIYIQRERVHVTVMDQSVEVTFLSLRHSLGKGLRRKQIRIQKYRYECIAYSV